MSAGKNDLVNIDFDGHWQCCCRQTIDNADDFVLTSVTDKDPCWLSVKLPHIVDTVKRDDRKITSPYNWWYRKQFKWTLSDKQSEQQVYLTFESSNDEKNSSTSNVTATIWLNGEQVFSGSLLSLRNPIELTKKLLHSEETAEKEKHGNTLVVCCANMSLSLHARLIVHGTVICASGQVNLGDKIFRDNNDPNQKQNNILKYSVSVNDTDGRIGVLFNSKQNSKASLPSPRTKRPSETIIDQKQTNKNKEDLDDISVPRLAIVILIVGTRGDVQPFIALGQALLAAGHRVRLATHEPFRSFVRDNGLEFFPLAGDPADLMSFMVKNAGIIPSISSIAAGDVAKKRRTLADILASTWLACTANDDETLWPFTAEAIIANPPSFGHVHCAEKLQIPLHIMFTMPWSPTTAFPHPLCNLDNSKGSREKINLYSYYVIDMLTWSGMHNIVNNFRKNILGLSLWHAYQATNILIDERVPHTYCWSSALVPKPPDWGAHIDVSGFFFLDLGTAYTNPPADLLDFLGLSDRDHDNHKLPPPIYIGFGSITGHDPRRLLGIVVDALDKTGYRALLAGLATDTDCLPKNIFKIGNVPHDWLFQHVSAVCHHGGAGTTAAGLRAGKPTIIVPFFGDQFFWGDIIEKSGAGPRPLPGKSITVDELAEAFQFVHQPTTRAAAERIRVAMVKENGCAAAVRAFHANLPVARIRSDLDSTFAACYRVDGFNIQISRPVVHVLVAAGVIDISQLRSHHTRKWQSNHNGRIRILNRRASQHTNKSLSKSNSSNNLAMTTRDGAKSFDQDIDHLTIGSLSSYGEMTDTHDHVSSLYNSYSELNTRHQLHVTNFMSGAKAAGLSLLHGRKGGFTGFVKRPLSGHQRHGVVGGAAEALVATVNAAMKPAISTFPSTTWLGQATYTTVKEAVLTYRTDGTGTKINTLDFASSSSTTSDEQQQDDDHEISPAAKIAAAVSGFDSKVCQKILLGFDKIKMEREQTMDSSSPSKIHFKSKFQLRRQRSHSVSDID